MAKKMYEESSIQAIADAIREKTGGSEAYLVSAMAEAIRGIESGGVDIFGNSHVSTGSFILSIASDKYTITHGLGVVPSGGIVFYAPSSSYTFTYEALLFASGYLDKVSNFRQIVMGATTSGSESATRGVGANSITGDFPKYRFFNYALSEANTETITFGIPDAKIGGSHKYYWIFWG